MTTPSINIDFRSIIVLIVFGLLTAFTATASNPSQTFSHVDLTEEIAPLTVEADAEFFGGGAFVTAADSIQNALLGGNEYFAHLMLILLVGSVVFIQSTRRVRVFA